MAGKPGSRTLSTEELMRLEAELAARVVRSPNPPPIDSLPATPGPGSNVAYVSREENARLGMGQFAKMTADETHRLAARLSRR